ncbi:MAG: beta-agarase [Pseudomonas sp.]
MIRRSLPGIFALLVAAPSLAQAMEQQTLFNFVSPADVVQVQMQNTSLPSMTAELAAESEPMRRVTFNPSDNPNLRLTPQNGVWDWSKANVMTLRIQNAMDWALTLDIRMESSDGKVLTSRVALPAGPAQNLLVPLHATSPRSQGMRAGPAMPWVVEGQRVILADTVEGDIDLSKVTAVGIYMSRPDSAQSILLGRFGVREGDDTQEQLYTGIVDAYGQYVRGQWPEKVSSDEQLKAAAGKEANQLKGWLGKRAETDQYGGLLGGPTFDASGFFRTEKRDGRWFLVTPEGHPFYSLGVNTVSAGNSATYVEGRESMFTGLPKDGEPLAAYYGGSSSRADTGAAKGRNFDQGRWFDFYRANLQRTYPEQPCANLADKSTAQVVSDDDAEAPADGSATPAVAAAPAPAAAPAKAEAKPAVEEKCVTKSFDATRWTQNTLDRLQAWGFNTLGNWSDPSLAAAKRMPYTLPLSISGDYKTISTGVDWWGGMPDPFDPRFAMAAERAVAIATRDHRDDPWLVGFFADNELAWAGPANDPNARYALAYGTLSLTTDVPAKRAFLKMLRDKYRNQDGLSKAWGIELSAWELMEDPGFQAPRPNPEHPAIEADMQQFQRLFADAYFKTIDDALNWHAPNHLLLGGRFAASNPEAVASCAQYCDVLSFNFYTKEPQHGYDFAALKALDKPVLVTEFHFGSRDRGPFWGGVSEVYNEEQRGPAYAHFVEEATKEPMIVGTHLFQYLDQPVTGRLLDGENGHFGLVAITDRPFDGFVKAVRNANVAALQAVLKPVVAPAPAAPAKADGGSGKAGEGKGKGGEGKGGEGHGGPGGGAGGGHGGPGGGAGGAGAGRG